MKSLVGKGFVLCVCLLILCSGLHLFAQDAQKPLPTWTISVNPLGFLQFGPVVQAERKITENAVVLGSFRFHSLGLMSTLVNGDDDVIVGIGSAAIGAGYRYFYSFSNTPNQIYFGGVLEVCWIYGDEDVGDPGESKYSNTGIVYMGNFGYRWRFPNNFSISTGAYFGGYREFFSEWWYVNDYSYYSAGEKIQGSLTSQVFGMAELAFNWEY
jgi:hypothetical protein